MDKLEPILSKDSFTQSFRYKGKDWTLTTEWGDITTFENGSTMFYVFEKENSSIFNLTLVGMAMKKTNPEITFSFEEKLESRCILQIKTPIELLTYNFIISPYGILRRLRKEIQKTSKFLDTIKFLISGVAVPKLLNEYGKRDSLMILDYSQYNLPFPPLVFPFIIGREGYVSISNRTKTDCTVYIHWNKVDPLDPENNTWKLGYCLVPQEVDKPPILYERFDLEKLRTVIKDGRGYTLFEDKVIDIKYFFERHIGGPYMLSDIVGKEIGRFIYGSVPKEGKAHHHSAKAENLIEKYQVGIFVDSLIREMYVGLPIDKTISEYLFTLKDTESITDKIAILKLKPQDIQIQPVFSNPNNFGKYFALTSLSKKITRNYYCCFLLDKKVVDSHLALSKAIDKNAAISPAFDDIAEVKYNTASIAVKAMGEYSSWLISPNAKNENFSLRGPFVILLNLTTLIIGSWT